MAKRILKAEEFEFNCTKEIVRKKRRVSCDAAVVFSKDQELVHQLKPNLVDNAKELECNCHTTSESASKFCTIELGDEILTNSIKRLLETTEQCSIVDFSLLEDCLDDSVNEIQIHVEGQCSVKPEVHENSQESLMETKEKCPVISLLDDNEEGSVGTSSNDYEIDSDKENAGYTPSIELTIDQLDLFAQSLCMKAKVIEKSAIKERDAVNKSDYFIYKMLDRTGIISVIVHDEICNSVYSILEVGKVYNFEKISSTKDLYRSNLYQLTLNENSVIEEIVCPCLAERRNYVYTELVREIQNQKSGKIVDFQGSVRHIGDIHSFTVRHRTFRYCDVIMADYEDNKIKVIFLDQHAMTTRFWAIRDFLTLEKVRIIISESRKSLIVDETATVSKDNVPSPESYLSS